MGVMARGGMGMHVEVSAEQAAKEKEEANARLIEEFRAADVDGDGRVSKDEFAAFKKAQMEKVRVQHSRVSAQESRFKQHSARLKDVEEREIEVDEPVQVGQTITPGICETHVYTPTMVPATGVAAVGDDKAEIETRDVGVRT